MQQLGSVWVTGFEGVPSWFSDGFGRAVAAMIAGKGDKRVKGWEQQIASIVMNMKEPKELLSGKMNEEDAAIVGYGLVRKLIEGSNRKQFDALVKSLEKIEFLRHGIHNHHRPTRTNDRHSSRVVLEEIVSIEKPLLKGGVHCNQEPTRSGWLLQSHSYSKRECSRAEIT